MIFQERIQRKRNPSQFFALNKELNTFKLTEYRDFSAIKYAHLKARDILSLAIYDLINEVHFDSRDKPSNI